MVRSETGSALTPARARARALFGKGNTPGDARTGSMREAGRPDHM